MRRCLSVWQARHSPASGADVAAASVSVGESVADAASDAVAAFAAAQADKKKSPTTTKNPEILFNFIRISDLCIISQIILVQSSMHGSDKDNVQVLDLLIVWHNRNY
jgi:hypothetical protein